MERTLSVSSVSVLQKPSRPPIRAKLVMLYALLPISDSPAQNLVTSWLLSASSYTVIIQYHCEEDSTQVPIPDQAFRTRCIRSEAALGSIKMWVKPPVCKNSLMPLIHYSNANNKKVPGEMLQKLGVTRISFLLRLFP